MVKFGYGKNLIPLKVSTHEGLVLETSCRDKSYCMIFLFLPLLVAGSKIWPLQLVPKIPCNLFLKTLHVNCSWDKCLRPVPLCKLLKRLHVVAGTSHTDQSLVCADLWVLFSSITGLSGLANGQDLYHGLIKLKSNLPLKYLIKV